VTPKAKLLLVFNAVALTSATAYFLYWLSVMVQVMARSIRAEHLPLHVLLIALMVVVLISAIHLALRLKLRILRDAKDPDLPPVRTLYKSASRLQFSGYLVFYPLMFGLLGNARVNPEGTLLLFIAIAMVTALPLWALVRRRQDDYDALKDRLGIGRHDCPSCRVSLTYARKERLWGCWRCRRRYSPRPPSRA